MAVRVHDARWRQVIHDAIAGDREAERMLQGALTEETLAALHHWGLQEEADRQRLATEVVKRALANLRQTGQPERFRCMYQSVRKALFEECVRIGPLFLVKDPSTVSTD